VETLELLLQSYVDTTNGAATIEQHNVGASVICTRESYRPRVADGVTASNIEGICEYIQ